MIDLGGKTALITGGGAGIGRAIVEAFAQAGARIVIVELDPQRAASAANDLQSKGVESYVSVTDVRDPAAIDALACEIVTRFGGLDILVNNVGDYLGLIKPLEEFSVEEIDAVYSTNLKSLFLVSRAMIPLLRSGGSVISVSSIEAFRAIPNMAVYGACKHAITGLTRSLALELGPRGIRVNAIAPETTDTAQIPIEEMIPAEHRDKVALWLPLGRFGRPQDAAGAALFLASDLSSWITGATINLDGGALAACGWYRVPAGGWTNTPIILGSGFGA